MGDVVWERAVTVGDFVVLGVIFFFYWLATKLDKRSSK